MDDSAGRPDSNADDRQVAQWDERLQTIAVMADLDDLPRRTLLALLAEIDGLEVGLAVARQKLSFSSEEQGQVRRLREKVRAVRERLRSIDRWW
jgi:hypothetical protein